MQVVGYTTQQHVFIASRKRKFNINEILVIEDDRHNNPKGEVIETQSFNRFVPLSTEKNALVDEKVLQGLRQVGFSIDEEEINLAKVRLLEELSSPVKVGVSARLPVFEEVENLFLKKRPEEGLVLGVIQGTAEIASTLPEDLRNVAPLYQKDQGILPQDGFPFIFDYAEMDSYPHIGIFGGSGSGKSYGLRVFLEEIMIKEIPTIVFDPHYEMDFSQTASGFEDKVVDFKSRFVTLMAGKDVGIDFTELSPDDLVGILKASGGNISEAMDNAVRSIFEPQKDTLASFTNRLSSLIDAFDNETEIKRLKNSDNWSKLDVREKKRYEYLEELLLKYKDKVGHASTLKGIAWRLNKLQREGIFTKDISEIEKSLQQRKLVVVRGSIWLLKVFAGFIAKKLYNKRRAYRDALHTGKTGETGFPPFILVTDEAHNFAPTGFDAPAKGVFKEIAQEGRKYGVFLILATQRPSLLDDTITAQLNTKLVFRTVRSTDIHTIKEETDITSEEGARLPYLSSGTAFISSAILGRTIAVRIRAARTTSPHSQNPFDELQEWAGNGDDKLWSVLEDYLPLSGDQIHLYHDEIQKKLEESVDVNKIFTLLEEMESQGKVKKEDTPFGPSYHKV